MSDNEDKPLNFEVSTGLKNVLGSELITDDEVAIFELVKNSFDANAKNVYLYFDKDKIGIVDDGIGMSYEDIQTKWLFVAYSSKRKIDGNFRDSISDRKFYAGSKGIGRFSSDRLGQIVNLQTRPKAEEAGPVHSVKVDWGLFDINYKDKFQKISVNYSPQPTGFILPPKVPHITHGTVITIEKVRQTWDREKLLKLKSSLAKLINPFGSSADEFRIRIIAPSEIDTDVALSMEAKDQKRDLPPNSTVNGDVGNFIFSTLQEKTTFIEVQITPQGFIESSLTDRGELIYRIKEPNTSYPLLKDSGFHCILFYLNQSAKLTFARRMGVPSVQFGSVFLFRNEFRVYPIGNEGDDWFGIDRRKQQGYARFLGSRDLIGRIDVSGRDNDFQHPPSRNNGLIETPAVEQLQKCFREHCLKRLERYVVPVTFVDKDDKNTSDTSRLSTDPGRARVTSAVAKIVDSDEIELIEYSKNLIGILDERSAHFEGALASLRAIAEKTKDSTLFESIENAERRFQELRQAEEIARRQAEEERSAKEIAQSRAAIAEERVIKVIEQYEEEKKRNLFLSNISTLDTDTILNLHHQITIYAVDIQQQIENFLLKISKKEIVSKADAINALEAIALLNRKVMGISKFATKANFRLESEMIEADLGEYIEEYVENIARDFLLGRVTIEVENDHHGFVQRFKPIDVSVIIDNLISNSRKARANKINIKISHPNKGILHVKFLDNGQGFHKSIDDPSRVFEKGFTTTDGSGLGLFHVKHVLGEMNGTIEAGHSGSGRGASFLIRISK